MSDPQQRRADARRRAELAAAAERAEAEAAQSEIDAFVTEMERRGIRPEPLRAMLLKGGRVKSNRVGWYLNNAKTLAVGPGGEFFRLMVSGSALARWRGAPVEPTPPPLVIARGGRDGESGDLRDFLARALAAYSRP